jgi:hypothetical protein
MIRFARKGGFMTNRALKSMSVATSMLFVCSLATSQSTQPTETSALHVEQNIPTGNAVLFVSPAIGGTSLGFFIAPDGTTAAIPVSEVKQAMDLGYRPVTFGDLVQGIDSYVKTIQEQQKRFDELTSDYNGLVARFNRLAAINASTPAAAYSPAQSNDDEKRAMRLMLFQSLLSRTAGAPPPSRIQVTDCNAYPALCVH